MPVVINNDTTIVTSDLSMCAAMTSGGDYCVLAGTDIAVNAYLRGTGSRPLVLIATGAITTSLHGLIDVGSHRIRAQQVPEVGAGADFAACAPGVFPGSGGGGAGGSFVAQGGIGGVGGRGGNGGTPGDAVTTVGLLRGGCPGQDGEGPTSDKGLAGHGGGAVYLISGMRIDVQGGIASATSTPVEEAVAAAGRVSSAPP